VAIAVTQLRLQRGWNQAELAQRAELSEAVITAVESECAPAR
jgi:ribosome-binding protein aMBF1 (putative translation factor)